MKEPPFTLVVMFLVSFLDRRNTTLNDSKIRYNKFTYFFFEFERCKLHRLLWES